MVHFATDQGLTGDVQQREAAKLEAWPPGAYRVRFTLYQDTEGESRTNPLRGDSPDGAADLELRTAGNGMLLAVSAQQGAPTKGTYLKLTDQGDLLSVLPSYGTSIRYHLEDRQAV